MSIIKLFSITFLLIYITFGAIGGCGGGYEDNNGESSGNGGELAGEQNCTDGIDNDGDTEIDCDDIDCILDPECAVEDPPSDTLTLIEPINNQVIQQNNPDIGCPFLENRGFGFEVFFDWTDSSSPNGISGYFLTFGSTGATIPPTPIFVVESEFSDLACNGFVIDPNLMGWEWTVQAVDNEGNISEVSDPGIYQFGPCRLEYGAPCNAPAP